MLNVLDGGLQTTVQDAGRFSWYHIGMPPAGAMDQYSFRVGNMLVGNPADAAALEITFAGPLMETTDEGVIAVTGADLWVTHRVRPGDQVVCGQVERGVRAYFCISGGITIPPLLGSRSTYLLARFGGVEGRRLQAGDLLPVGPPPPRFGTV